MLAISGAGGLHRKIYWFSEKIISVLNAPHPVRGLKMIVFAVARNASAASFGEASSTFASERARLRLW